MPDARYYARLIRDKRVFLCGNGGSAANAIHVANDLVGCGVSATPLCADIATLTAIANDFGYEQVFAKQIQTHGRADDVLISFSGSGKSPNIIEAIRRAKIRYMTTISLTGEFTTKNTVAEMSHYSLRVGRDMQKAENYQLVWGHSVMKALQWLQKKTS